MPVMEVVGPAVKAPAPAVPEKRLMAPVARTNIIARATKESPVAAKEDSHPRGPLAAPRGLPASCTSTTTQLKQVTRQDLDQTCVFISRLEGKGGLAEVKLAVAAKGGQLSRGGEL